jgi:polysaccharide biosynthesis/export protein
MDLVSWKTRYLRISLISAVSLVLAAACSSSVPSPSTPSDPRRAGTGIDEATKVSSSDVPTDSSDLEALWTSRMSAQATNQTSQFTLGPGDLLKISVPQIPQLRDRDVRVSEENTIALPLLGEINVNGMSEEDLRNELSRRVGKYMYQPEVEVFVQHTESRQVAVIGAVKVPGRYTLSSRSDTIMTMISHAGGLADYASTRILLIPAGEIRTRGSVPEQPAAEQSAGDFRLAEADPGRISAVSVPAGAESPDAVALRMMSHRAIIDTARTDEQRYLELPAMPGDVIIVPAAGEVTVQGWVDKAGSFKITPGMTAMAAIAAAGGANFTGSATLLREQDDGRKLQIPLDLSKIKGGEQPDVQVQSGDVVVVERSALGAVPYTVYFLAQHIGMGMGFSAI